MASVNAAFKSMIAGFRVAHVNVRPVLMAVACRGSAARLFCDSESFLEHWSVLAPFAATRTNNGKNTIRSRT